MENKNQKKSFLKRLFSKKAAASVGAAVKVLTSVVLGAAMLAGTYGVVKTGVIPTTEAKVSSMYEVTDVVNAEGSGGVTVPDPVVEISHNGVIPEGGTYTAANGTVYNAGDTMPSSVSVGDVYTYGDYKYSKSNLSLLEEFGYSSVDEFKANCETDLGLTWDECVAENGSEGDLLIMLLSDYGWNAELNLNVTDKNQSSYGQILYSINNRTVDCLNNTFRDCRYMTTSPTIPSGVMALNRTFYGCSSLINSPTMPDGLLAMNYSFYNCGSLVNAPTIPNSVTYMDYAFSGCTSLVTAPTIPNSVTNMLSTFDGCTSLVSVPAIPDSVINMSSTFSGCTSLETAPTIPNSVTDMSGTFSGCTSLETVPTIPNSVTNMLSTFYDCTSLVSAPVISDSVTDMTSTFDGCTSLVNAPVIPDSVTNMTYTFHGCTSLTGTIEVNANPTSYNSCFSGTQITGVTGSCLQETKDALMATK